jgi:hypothetical protein
VASLNTIGQKSLLGGFQKADPERVDSHFTTSVYDPHAEHESIEMNFNTNTSHDSTSSAQFSSSFVSSCSSFSGSCAPSSSNISTLAPQDVAPFIPPSNHFITLSPAHGKAFAKKYGLKSPSSRDQTRMYANAHVEYIRDAVVDLITNYDWRQIENTDDGVQVDITSPSFGTEKGGIRLQLPAYASLGSHFSKILKHVVVEPSYRHRDDEQIITEYYADTIHCPPLMNLLAVLQYLFPGYVVALLINETWNIEQVIQLKPGPVVNEWMLDRQDDLKRILAVDEDAQHGRDPHMRYADVAGVLLKAQGVVPSVDDWERVKAWFRKDRNGTKTWYCK